MAVLNAPVREDQLAPARFVAEYKDGSVVTEQWNAPMDLSDEELRKAAWREFLDLYWLEPGAKVTRVEWVEGGE